jgi:DNA mismatch endonuclease (patch repair protein)
MADWLTPEQRSRNMAAIRSAGTSAERRLAAVLRTLFPRRRIIERTKDLPGRPDFYLPGLKLAIFADGCFWHGCPKHGRLPGDNPDYWRPKLARNAARDRAAVRALRAQGIRTVRIWEHDLEVKKVAAVMKRINRLARASAGRRAALQHSLDRDRLADAPRGHDPDS